MYPLWACTCLSVATLRDPLHRTCSHTSQIRESKRAELQSQHLQCGVSRGRRQSAMATGRPAAWLLVGGVPEEELCSRPRLEAPPSREQPHACVKEAGGRAGPELHAHTRNVSLMSTRSSDQRENGDEPRLMSLFPSSSETCTFMVFSQIPPPPSMLSLGPFHPHS